MIEKVKYVYGADRDGNRGEIREDYEIYSDYSNEELDEDSTYAYKGKNCSYNELLKFLGVVEKCLEEEDHTCCDDCEEEIEDIYYSIIIQGHEYLLCSECLKKYLDEKYKVSFDDEEDYEY